VGKTNAGTAPTRCVDAAKLHQHVQRWCQTRFSTISAPAAPDLSHHSARGDIGMSGCNIGIHVYVGLLLGIIKQEEYARELTTTSRGSQRGAVARCLTLCRKVGNGT